MKNLLLVTTLLITILGNTNGQNTENVDQTEEKQKVVVNHKMIEKFNNTEFPENAISFNDLLTNYSITEVKLIVAAYHSNEFTFESKEILNEKLAELKEQIDNGELKQDSMQKLLTQIEKP